MKFLVKNAWVITAVVLGILIVYLFSRGPRSPAPEQPATEQTATVDTQPSPQERIFASDFWESATLESFRELQAAGVDFKVYDEKGWTPLMHAAVSCADTGVMREIIAYSGDLFYQAEDGHSLRTLVAQNENLKDTAIHKDLESWHQNELHHQMALKAEMERKKLDARKDADTDADTDADPDEESSAVSSEAPANQVDSSSETTTE